MLIYLRIRIILIVLVVSGYSSTGVAGKPAFQPTYKVISSEPWDLQEMINKESKDDWQVKAMSTYSKCIRNLGNLQEKYECLIVILEKQI
jgi:hypothetical protein